MRRFVMLVGVLALVCALCVALLAKPQEVRAEGTVICFEAESGAIEAPFEKATTPKADKKPVKPQKSSGGYVLIPAKANGAKKGRDDLPGKVTFKVKVPAKGEYWVWGRCLWPNGCGNSFYVRKADGKNQIMGEDGTYDVWHWMKCRDFKLALSQGVNTIIVANREDGVMLDQVFLTTTDRVPQGAEKVTAGALAE
jgi:hypothetical protein